jgi:UPF0755 protein
VSLTRKGKWGIALGVLVLIVAGAALGGYLYLRSLGVYGSSDPGELVSIKIPKGATAVTVGQILVDEGIIDSTLGWRIATYLKGGADGIQAGRYQLPTGLVARDALARLLAEGPEGEEFVTVTFQEGLWLAEFADKVANVNELSGDKFLDLVTSGAVTSELAPDVDSLEGLLFPDTYQIAASDTERKVAERLVRQMKMRVQGLDPQGPAAELTPYELVTVASMIEAETRIDSERPMVARVIYNRLEQNIALGIDATFLFALQERKEFLTESDLAIDSPYNSRTNLGLPPTPIGAPGLASLKAAAVPADGTWLYYVLNDCEGNHAFSESYQEFLDNKAIFQSLDC